MKTPSLDALQQEAIRQYNLVKTRKRKRYHLARALGFTPAEAKVLSGRSEEYVRTLAGQLKAS